jgi:hypothetical protein
MMDKFKGWMTGRFVGMAVSFCAGVLFMLSQSAQPDLAGQEPARERRKQREGDAPTADKRKVLNFAASTTPPLGVGFQFLSASSVPGNGSIPTLTGDPSWSNGVPYNCTLTFPTTGAGPADFTTFVNNFVDASAYYQDLPTSNKAKWNLIRFASTPATQVVTLTFLPQCPFNITHILTPHSTGTGRIIVISLAVPTVTGNVNGAPTNLNFIHHGTIGAGPGAQTPAAIPET